MTPMNVSFTGTRLSRSLCGVSILRAGEAFEGSLRSLCPGIPIGKILIQRDEITCKAQVTPKLASTASPIHPWLFLALFFL